MGEQCSIFQVFSLGIRPGSFVPAADSYLDAVGKLSEKWVSLNPMLANRKTLKTFQHYYIAHGHSGTKFALLSGSARREVDSATGAQTSVVWM